MKNGDKAGSEGIGIASKVRLDTASRFYDGGRYRRGRCSGEDIVRTNGKDITQVKAPLIQGAFLFFMNQKGVDTLRGAYYIRFSR